LALYWCPKGQDQKMLIIAGRPGYNWVLDLEANKLITVPGRPLGRPRPDGSGFVVSDVNPHNQDRVAFMDWQGKLRYFSMKREPLDQERFAWWWGGWEWDGNTLVGLSPTIRISIDTDTLAGTVQKVLVALKSQRGICQQYTFPDG